MSSNPLAVNGVNLGRPIPTEDSAFLLLFDTPRWNKSCHSPWRTSRRSQDESVQMNADENSQIPAASASPSQGAPYELAWLVAADGSLIAPPVPRPALSANNFTARHPAPRTGLSTLRFSGRMNARGK